MSEILGLYGASGFGREVFPLLRQTSPTSNKVFVDDNKDRDSINGVPIFTFEEFLNLDYEEKKISVCIADTNIRMSIFEKLKANAIGNLSIVASNSWILDEVSIGEGAVICPFVTLTSNVKIGIGFHANIYSYVGHDCIIGDYVTFAPGVKCNGNVVIEDHVYVGTGAIIKQGNTRKPITIGKGALVGMGSVVTKSVPAGDIVFGVPARSTKTDG